MICFRVQTVVQWVKRLEFSLKNTSECPLLLTKRFALQVKSFQLCWTQTLSLWCHTAVGSGVEVKHVISQHSKVFRHFLNHFKAYMCRRNEQYFIICLCVITLLLKIYIFMNVNIRFVSNRWHFIYRCKHLQLLFQKNEAQIQRRAENHVPGPRLP